MAKDGFTIFPYTISRVEISSQENSTSEDNNNVLPPVVADSFFSVTVVVALACGALLALVIIVVVVAVVRDKRKTNHVVLPITDFFDKLKEFSRGDEMDSNEFSRDSNELNSSFSV